MTKRIFIISRFTEKHTKRIHIERCKRKEKEKKKQKERSLKLKRKAKAKRKKLKTKEIVKILDPQRGEEVDRWYEKF